MLLFIILPYSLFRATFELRKAEDDDSDIILHVKLWVEDSETVVDCRVDEDWQTEYRRVISDEFQLHKAYKLEFKFLGGDVQVHILLNKSLAWVDQ